MKFKTTLILFASFLVLLAFVLFFESKGKKEKGAEEKLVNLSSDDVQKIVFKKEDGSITFQKDKKGEWLITQPLEAKADKSEVNRLAEDFSKLQIERVVEKTPEEKDLKKYGIPEKEITLYFKEKELPLKILIGMENPLDKTFFAKKEGEARVVLIASNLKSLLEKKLFDFRQKDIFRFETDDVKSVILRAKKVKWEAQKKEDEWFLRKPIKALAESSKISDILYSLSNLRAKEFVSEEKKKEEIKKYGLDNPEYEITLAMPLANREVTFLLHKKDEKLYATSSLSSKIITADDSLLSGLEKEPKELRQKKLASFYSWKVSKLYLKKGEIEWTLTKDKEDNWHFESPLKAAANKEKIETFIRKIESLEASEFIDPPLKLSDYGLDHPQAEIKFWVKEDEKKTKEITVLVGSEDKEAKRVVVKNGRFNYLFQVDSAFLEEFPKELKNWKAEKKEEKKEKK